MHYDENKMGKDMIESTLGGRYEDWVVRGPLWRRHLTWEPSGKEAAFWGKVFQMEGTANKNTITGLGLVYLRKRKAATLTGAA